uniref:Uncharacterized protein n=1 Tax=Arundo donax TaxID=35708 RepID=A0A0A9GKB0_ARUDO
MRQDHRWQVYFPPQPCLHLGSQAARWTWNDRRHHSGGRHRRSIAFDNLGSSFLCHNDSSFHQSLPMSPPKIASEGVAWPLHGSIEGFKTLDISQQVGRGFG